MVVCYRIKKGSAPVLYESAMKALKKDSRTRIRNSDCSILKWANGVIWEKGNKEYRLNVIGTEKENGDGCHFYMQPTSLFIKLKL